MIRHTLNPSIQVAMMTREDLRHTTLEKKKRTLEDRLEAKRIGLDQLGRSPADVAHCQQIHTDGIVQVTTPGFQGEGDALITNIPGLIVQIGVADCVPVVIGGYDIQQRPIVSTIHSGRGPTSRNIVSQIIDLMTNYYDAHSLCSWIGPSAGPHVYEFGAEAYDLFDQKYIQKKNNHIYLDIAGQVYDQLIQAGISQKNITRDHSCTITDSKRFFSYRRDGKTGQNMYVRARISSEDE